MADASAADLAATVRKGIGPSDDRAPLRAPARAALAALLARCEEAERILLSSAPEEAGLLARCQEAERELAAAKRAATTWAESSRLNHERYRAAEAERDAAKKAWWDQRNEWAVATGKNMDVMAALEARAAELEQALRESDAHLSLLRYRANIDWSDPALPDEYDVDKTITASRAALQSGGSDE